MTLLEKLRIPVVSCIKLFVAVDRTSLNRIIVNLVVGFVVGFLYWGGVPNIGAPGGVNARCLSAPAMRSDFVCMGMKTGEREHCAHALVSALFYN